MSVNVLRVEWGFPKFLDLGTADDLYRLLQDGGGPNEIVLDMTACEWVEHFELQKLAVHITTAASSLGSVTIRVPTTADAEIRRAADVVIYAAAAGFFSYLSNILESRLRIEKSNDKTSVFEPHAFSEYIAGLRLQTRPLGRRPPTAPSSYPHSSLPFQSISGWRSVDDISERFTSGEQLRELIERYSTLDIVASGEFATLIINEVAENVVEHAFASIKNAGADAVAAAVSVTTVQLGSRDEPTSRIVTRMKKAPEYERLFLQDLTAAIGYLELTISDTGGGIITSLRRRPDLFDQWVGHASPSDEELLAVAFHAHVTSDPGPHRPGRRGLYYVAECVAEYGGILVCETNGLRLVITPQTGSPQAADVHRYAQAVRGTHIRVLLPIEATPRRAADWSTLDFTRPEHLRDAAISALPTVRSLPPAVALREPHRREALLEFKRACCEAVNPTDVVVDLRDISWLSAANTRRWRKQHIQLFLDELTRHEEGQAIVIVNVPETVAMPMRFIARYLLGSNQQQVLIIVTEDARRAIVSQQLMATRRHFEQWASKRDGYVTGDFTAAGQMMASIAGRFRSAFRALSFNDACLLVGRAGIASEFKGLVTGVAIRPDNAVTGYVELDDATRDPIYTRTLSACIAVMVKRVFEADGVIAVSRAATRLLEHMGIAAWSMSTSDEALPHAKWWRRRKRICIVTDVMARGHAIAALLRRIDAFKSTLHDPPLIVGVVVPIIAEARSPIAGGRITRPTTAPRMAWLNVDDTYDLPVLLVHEVPAFEVGDAIDAARSAERFNLHAVARADSGFNADMSVPAFVRSIEQREALWFGHVEIGSTHFDLEVDMTRLFAGSEALAEFAARIADHIVNEGVDLILYPDDSRIQLATTSAVDDALAQRSASMPLLTRAPRSASGGLFLTERDTAAIRDARHILVIDDAINTGNTIKELLRLVSQLALNARRVTVYPFISREFALERQFLRNIPHVVGATVSWREFVRFPITFWSAAECPQCRRAAFARAAGIIASPLLQRPLRAFAKRVRPAVYGSDREPEPSRGRGGVRVFIPGHGPEPFATLAGACAAIAAVVAENVASATDLLQILNKNPYPAELAAFAIYMVCSRAGADSTVWNNSEFRNLYAATARSLAAQNIFTVENDGHANPLLLLTLSAWFAPNECLPALFARLMKALAPLLESNTYYEEAIVLALRVAEISNISKAVIQEIEDAVNANNALEQLQKRPPPGPASPPSQILMRLRHVAQVALREPVEQPWIEGVAHVLPILSYRVGHPRLGLIDDETRQAARDALESARLAQDAAPEQREAAVKSFFQHARAVLDSPTAQIEFLETSLSSALGTWFRALRFQHEWHSKQSPRELISDLQSVEQRIGQLRRYVRRAQRIIGGGDLTRSAAAIADILRLQDDVVNGLFASAPAREVVEQYLTAMRGVLSRHTKTDLQKLFETTSVAFSGSFFDAADLAARDAGGVPWVVVIAPAEALDDILLNALVRNPQKHVASRYPGQQIDVRAEINGLEKGTQKLTIVVSVHVSGQIIELGDNVLTKTLGNRQTLLNLCGGDITVHQDEAGRPVELEISLVAGDF